MDDENTKNGGDCYRQSFLQYVRNGVDNGLTVGADPEGGYRTPPSMSQRISAAVIEASPFRTLASVETLSSDVLTLVDDEGDAEDSLEPESESTSTPLLAKRTIPTHELYAQPKATAKLVEDTAIDVEAWLAGKIADIFARQQNIAFFHGTGQGQPHGILPYVGREKIEAIRSGANGEVTANGIITLYRSLPTERAKRAWFIMHRETAASVRQLQDPTTSAYLWQPGLSAGAPDTLAGVPVKLVNDMPQASTGSLAIAIGDFQAGYKIVDRPPVRILRDPFTEKPFVKFYATTRVGGDVVDTDAIKVLRLAA